MDKANGDSLPPHENTMPDTAPGEEEEEEEELLGAVGGAPVDAATSQSEAYFLWLHSLEEEEEQEKEERRRRLLREELSLEREEHKREEERRRQALERRPRSLSLHEICLKENWIRYQVNTTLVEKANLETEYRQKQEEVKKAVKNFFEKRAEVQAKLTAFDNYNTNEGQFDECFWKVLEELDEKQKEFSEAARKKDVHYDACIKVMNQKNACSQKLAALHSPARRAEISRSSMRNMNRYWAKVRKYLKEIECWDEQRDAKKIERQFKKILKKNSEEQLESRTGVFYNLSWFSSHGVIDDTTSESSSSSDFFSSEYTTESSNQKEYGDLEHDAARTFNRTGASASVSVSSPQNDTSSGAYQSDVEGYDGDVEGTDERSSDSEEEESSSSSSSSSSDEGGRFAETRWKVSRWHLHNRVLQRDTSFLTPTGSESGAPSEHSQQASSRQDDFDPSDTNQQERGGEDASQQPRHERTFDPNTEHEHTTDANGRQSSRNTEQSEDVESSTENRSSQVAEEGRRTCPVPISLEQTTTMIQSSDVSVSEQFVVSQYTDAAYGYGFDREGHNNFLYGLQAAVSRDSEYVVTTLRTVALQSYTMNKCLSNRKSHRSRRVRSSQRKNDRNSTLSVSSGQEMYRDFYELVAVADTSTANLEQKVRSSRASITTVPIKGWRIGFAYDYNKEPSKEYAGILHTHKGSVTSTAEIDTFVTTIVWNTDKQGFSGHLAGCYGWGNVKNSRFVCHGDTIAVAKGTPKSTICGGLAQLGYRFSISNTVYLMPYIECLVSTVTWQSYNEGFTPLPCSITRNKEKVIEKSIGIYNRWQRSARSQLYVWVAGISGYCQTDSLALRPKIRQHPFYDVRIPGKKKQYNKGEVGVSYNVKMKDTIYIGVRGKIQYMSSHNDRIDKDTSMNIQYVY